MTTPRRQALEEAANLIDGDRNDVYGPPSENFTRIAAMWTAYKGVEFTPADVAAFMALTKLSRLARTPGHRDSWVDLAGYAACGLEVAQ